ncbi:hypothetical protein SISSUDRAFT_963646, partial [Sistotremastrum suecicum HHB10207 ss-3]
LPKGNARKLAPKYIGPMKILENYNGVSFKIEIPNVLKQRGIHPVFHASKLRIHHPNDDNRFPGRTVEQVLSSFGEQADEWLVEKIIGHKREGRDLKFEVEYKSGEIAWLPYREVKHLTPLATYLELLNL